MLIHCWCEFKMVQLPWKTIWQFPKWLKIITINLSYSFWSLGWGFIQTQFLKQPKGYQAMSAFSGLYILLPGHLVPNSRLPELDFIHLNTGFSLFTSSPLTDPKPSDLFFLFSSKKSRGCISCAWQEVLFQYWVQRPLFLPRSQSTTSRENM